MISLLQLSKFVFLGIFFTSLICSYAFSADPVDIWNKENTKKENTQLNDENEITIESPILSDDVNKITIGINEEKISKPDQNVIGIFDPEENNFSLNMNMIQSLYRGANLNTIIGSGDKLVDSPLKNKFSLKSFILKFPLGSIIKYKLIIFILGILGKKAPKKSR